MRMTGSMIREILSDQRGAAIVLVVGSMLVVLAVTALAVDIGKLVTAKGEAQRAADSGALAAASAFIDDPDNAEVVAKARAKQFSELHAVRGQTVIIMPDADVQVDLPNLRVDVTVRQVSTRSNPIPTFFARVFGVDEVDVQAHAAAEAYPAGDIGCLLPLALPDMWDDTLSNDKWEWDDLDKDKALTPGVDEYEPYRACSLDPDDATKFIPPDCTGWGGPWRNCPGPNFSCSPNPYKNDVGRPVTLKPGNPQQAMEPGWFFPWRPVGDTGGDDYRENIQLCIDPTGLFDEGGEFVDVNIEPGNMIGPTLQGFEDRIGGDTNYWQDGCTGGTSCILPAGASYGGPRMVVVPLFDPTTILKSGMQPVKFTGFARLFINEVTNKDVEANWLRVGGSAGTNGEDGSASGVPLALRLIE